MESLGAHFANRDSRYRLFERRTPVGGDSVVERGHHMDLVFRSTRNITGWLRP
jgi:hypothetical protein